uniref:Uncharacterized protein n=1 Tax=viral metagenome TaxID=1070528 RepID=A0A6C0F9D0_9ZZZZ|tara:strand:- start:2955 stop:3485 length:531 start_codon:yes stop_codon:yes gene_type:complete
MEGSQMESSPVKRSENKHKLSDKWVLWAHLPHNTDWSLKSYIKILEVSNVESVIALVNSLPEQMIKNCMLFFMKKGILPMWEDPKNCDGGCFSFKITNKNIPKVWKNLSYMLTGDSLTNNKKLLQTMNGITVSPKKSFCILKIWTSTLKYQNVKELNEVDDVSFQGCIFKKHKPGY